MSDPVGAVLFDVDGTLCAYERTAAELLGLAFERVGVEPFFDAADYEARYGAFAAESESAADLRERCFAAIARERGRDPELGRAVARAYAAERDHANVRPLEGVRRALEALDGRYRLGVVTNGAPGMQATKLRALGLADLFETVVHGGYDTAPKPDPEPFERALRAVDTPPERAVYVGNDPAADVVGANRAGLYSVLVDGGGSAGVDTEADPDLTVGTPGELVEEPW